MSEQERVEIAMMLGVGYVEVRVGAPGEDGFGATTIRMRPPSLRMQIELEQGSYKTPSEALLAQAYMCAKRGGYEGTIEEFGDLLEGDDTIVLEAALDRLCPMMAARREQQRLAAEQEQPELIRMAVEAALNQMRETQPELVEAATEEIKSLGEGSTPAPSGA